jgi:cell division protein ZapA (FtsZ GTPase activity inhibitor)
MSTETVEIQIGGQIFNLRSEEGDEKLHYLADIVNDRLDTVSDGASSISLRVALLAALNLAEELFDDRVNQRALLEKIEQRTLKINEYFKSS